MVLSLSRWQGKVAIVTGASAGMGASIVEKLVDQGVKVVGLARRAERVEETAKKLQGKAGKLYAVQADISKEEDIIKAFKWTSDNVGPVSILVNNAGVVKQTNLVEGNTEMWKQTFDTNVIGLCVATREAVKIMKVNNIDGHIIHINSDLGHRYLYKPFFNVYPASKFAVTALTETLRQELNHIGSKIKITSVSPGVTKTELVVTNNFVFDQNLLKELTNLAALNPEDVADAVLYALSTPPHVQVHELTIQAVGAE